MLETVREWNRELKEIDPYLELVRARENAPGLRPGRYYVLRHNPGAPVSLVPDEGWETLGSHVYDDLKGADLWSDQVTRERRRAEEATERAKERRRNREREERVEEFRDRAKAAFNPAVSMTRAGSWTYRAGAPRR